MVEELANRNLVDRWTKARIRSDVVGQRLGDDWVVVNLPSGWIYELDPIAARIWAALQAGEDYAAMASALKSAFDVTDAQLVTDIDAFMTSLVTEGLIEVPT